MPYVILAGTNVDVLKPPGRWVESTIEVDLTLEDSEVVDENAILESRADAMALRPDLRRKLLIEEKCLIRSTHGGEKFAAMVSVFDISKYGD